MTLLVRRAREKKEDSSHSREKRERLRFPNSLACLGITAAQAQQQPTPTSIEMCGVFCYLFSLLAIANAIAMPGREMHAEDRE